MLAKLYIEKCCPIIQLLLLDEIFNGLLKYIRIGIFMILTPWEGVSALIFVTE